jgi:hypothetical protein
MLHAGKYVLLMNALTKTSRIVTERREQRCGGIHMLRVLVQLLMFIVLHKVSRLCQIFQLTYITICGNSSFDR